MRQIVRVIGRVALGVIAFVILNFTKNVAAAIAFPIGGREFHAMFAYTGEGRLDVAWKVYLLYVGTLAGMARLLIAVGYPLRPDVVAWIATGVCALLWWQVVAWEPKSLAFEVVAVLLMWAIPFLVFGPILLTTKAMRRPIAERKPG
jgi:hypothetical protein